MNIQIMYNNKVHYTEIFNNTFKTLPNTKSYRLPLERGLKAFHYALHIL